MLTKKFGKKNFEKKFDKKILIHIITRKIPRGVLATRVFLACETLETNPEKILREILTKSLEKKLGKKFDKNSHSYNHEKNPAWGARNTRVSRVQNPRNKSRKNFEENFTKSLEKKIEKKIYQKNLIHIFTRKIPRKVLATRVCLACETLETNPEKILRKILTNKI